MALTSSELHLELADLKDKVLFISCPEEKLSDCYARINQIQEALKAAGCLLTLVISDDITIETLDENQMRACGWVKTPEEAQE